MRQYLSILVFFISMQVTGQVAFGQTYLFDIYASAGVSSVHSRDFNDFRDSWNEVTAANAKKPLTGIGPAYCREFGLAYRNIADIGIYWTNVAGSATMTYDGGSQHVFAYRRHQMAFEGGGGPTFGNNDQHHISITAGVSGGPSYFRSYHVYADGTKSNGSELAHNGLYNAWNMSGFLSAKYFLDIQNFRVMVKGSLIGTLFRATTFEDRSSARMHDFDRIPWDGLPTDLVKYTAIDGDNNQYAPYDYPNQGGKYVRDFFQLLQLQVGIAYAIHWPE